jgi:hypothetical protein
MLWGENARRNELALLVVTNALVVLAVAVSLWAVDLQEDMFDPDEYSDASRVKNDGFSGYMSSGGFGRPFTKTQLAVAFFLADYDPIGPRVISVVAGVASLFLILIAIRKTWPNWIGAALFVPFYLVFNEQLLVFFRWGMMLYSEYFLCTSALLFLLMVFMSGEQRRWHKVSAFLLCLITPWVYFSTVVSTAAGIAVAVGLRWNQLRARSLRSIAKVAREFWPFWIAVPSYCIASRFEIWQAGRRPSLLGFFFPTSDFPDTLKGMLQFVFQRTGSLYRNLVKVHMGFAVSFRHTVVSADNVLTAICLVLAVIGIAACVWRGRRDAKRAFIVLYTILLGCGILVLSLLDKYPYGDPRYALYLLLPVLLLAAYGWSDIAHFVAAVFRRVPNLGFGSFRTVPASRVALVLFFAFFPVAVAGVGFHRAGVLHAERSRRIAAADGIKNALRTDRSDLALISHDALCSTRLIAPELAERAVNMGYRVGTKWPVTQPAEDLLERLRTDPPKTVLVATYHAPPQKTHPHFMKLFPPGKWASDALPSPGKMYVVHLTRLDQSTKLPPRIGRSQAVLRLDGDLSLKGWVMAGEEVLRVELLLDGKLLGNATFPQRRPDVLAKFPEYGTDYCGFTYHAVLKEGTHPDRVTARAVGADGVTLGEGEADWRL